MVAILTEPQIDLEPKLEIKKNEAIYRADAIRNGHFNWFVDLLKADKQFGFVKGGYSHFGMLEFDTMNWLAEEFKGKDSSEPLFEDDVDFQDFKTDLVARFETYFGKLERTILPNKYTFDIKEKLSIYKSNFIKTINSSSEKQIDDWIKKIVFGEKPFYKNSNNWGRVADDINEKLKNTNPIAELNTYKETIAKFSELKNFKEVSEFFYNDPMGKKLFKLLEDVHGGWRNITYKQLNGVNVKKDYTINLDDRYREIIGSLKGLILGTLRTINTPADQVTDIVNNQISGYRLTSERDPELDSVFTFTLIGRIGALLEDLIQNERLLKDVINALTKSRDNLLNTLKMDANVAPFDALLKYYSDEN